MSYHVITTFLPNYHACHNEEHKHDELCMWIQVWIKSSDDYIEMITYACKFFFTCACACQFCCGSGILKVHLISTLCTYVHGDGFIVLPVWTTYKHYSMMMSSYIIFSCYLKLGIIVLKLYVKGQHKSGQGVVCNAPSYQCQALYILLHPGIHGG